MTGEGNQQRHRRHGVAIRSYTHAGQAGSECLFFFGTGFLGKPRPMLLRILRETTAEKPVEITRRNSRSPFRHLSPSDVPIRVLIVVAALIRERFDRWLVDLSLINGPFRP
jgi:hypothetical protein